MFVFFSSQHPKECMSTHIRNFNTPVNKKYMYKKMHVNMHFFSNMHVEGKSHVNIQPLFLMLAWISRAAVHGFPFLIPDL
jgi:hypothetical protein